MEYKNFEYDFVERTLSNIKWIDEQIPIGKKNGNSSTFYEVSNIINQCLGLILLPSQFSNHGFLSRFPQELKDYGVSDQIVNKIENNIPKTLENVLRHIRNGIAHGHIQQHTNSNKVITDIRILDAKQNVTILSDNDAHTIIEFTIKELKTFAIKVAEEYCKLKREELEKSTSL